MSRRGLFVAPFDALADPGLVGDLAATAEDAGWDGVFVWDHLQYGDRVTDIADPWICCAAIAMRTERVLLGPMVTPLARRRPQVVARQSASLAVLSGGRFVLGVGLGDDGVGEFSAFGDETDAKVRGAMLDDSLALVRGLLSGEPVAEVRFRPAAAVPVWVAGRFGNAPPVRRGAAHDGFFVIGVDRPDQLTGLRRDLDAAGARAGHALVVDVQTGVDPRPWAAAGADWVLTRIGPFDIDRDAAFALAAAGPDSDSDPDSGSDSGPG